ncbi:MAG: hypothetical protein IJR26_11210 [Bacteroidales bacterium]|nr:hypothetical protein [Bacteroidales bacterium]
MQKLFLILSAAALLASACNKHEDEFEFSGTVVFYEYCSQEYGFDTYGYLVELTSPSDIGGDYVVNGESLGYTNAVMAYGSNRLLKEGSKISGKMYLDPHYSKTTCNIDLNRECKEAVFTKVKVNDE